MESKKTISIFVPHVGCPNDCIFCNQRKITGQTESVDENDVVRIIEKQLPTIHGVDQIELAFFGGSFTAIDVNLQTRLLKAVEPYLLNKSITYIKISTRPDAIDEEKLQLLKSHGVKIIELGVQSLDENVLKHSNRGHDASCVYLASELIKSVGFELGLQMMIGLPKDSKNSILDTAYKFVDIAPKYVRIYPVLVIKETELENQLNIGAYKSIKLEDTLDIVSDLIAIFEKANIKIIRIGLQNSDSISFEGSVIDGPFHPSLGELCYSRVYRKILDNQFKNLGIVKGEVKVFVNEKEISKFIGNKKTNVEYFMSKGIILKIIGNKLYECKINYENNEFLLDLKALIVNLASREV